MTQPLRISVLTPRFAPFRGGVETYVASAAAALAAEGAEVTVITQTPRAMPLPRREMRDGYVIERHPLPIADVFDVPALSAARAAAHPRRFDVLWAHSYHTPLALIAAELARIPVVLTPHYHGVGHSALRQSLHAAYRPAGRRLMAASRRIIVDTDAEADLVLQDFPHEVRAQKVVVIPPLITDPTHGMPPRPGAPNVVLTVARQETYKRTDLLVRAMAELRNRGVAAQLVVVGDGSALASHRELATRLGADDVITFTGAVDDDTLTRWWATATVYATASEQEAYGIGLAEALRAGLPVVASGIPAHREVVRSAGPAAAAGLCTVGAPDAVAAAEYADAIAEALAMPESRQNRAAYCTLPGPADIARQLLDTIVSVDERVRL